MSARLIRHVVVRGRVQGVGFRMFVEDAAAAHGVEGWVRNRRDGSVEALFAGDDAAVAGMIEACRRGPGLAEVESVASEPAAEPAPRGFTQRPTE